MTLRRRDRFVAWACNFLLRRVASRDYEQIVRGLVNEGTRSALRQSRYGWPDA